MGGCLASVAPQVHARLFVMARGLGFRGLGFRVHPHPAVIVGSGSRLPSGGPVSDSPLKKHALARVAKTRQAPHQHAGTSS